MKQYFKVKMVSIKKDGHIKVVDVKGNAFKMQRMEYPYLRVGDVFEGQQVRDMASNEETVVLKKLLTSEDSEVIIATFPPKPPQDIKTP